MANKTTGELTAATTPLDGTEISHFVQAGNSRKVTVDAIRGPKLKSLVDLATAAGDLIYGLGSGLLARLAKGTAGQVLRMNASATAPEWAQPGFELIAFVRLSAPAASIIFASGLEKYVDIKAVGTLIPATGGGSILSRVSKTTGASWVQDANAYFCETAYFAGGGSASNIVSSTYISMGTTGAAAGGPVKIELDLSEFNTSRQTAFSSRSGYFNGAGSMIIDFTSGQMNSGVPAALGAYDGIQFYSNVGQLAAGSYVALYGQREA